MRNINVGGVPEHFNLPWHMCIEDGSFREAGLEVFWKDFPDGTGAMCKALRNREIDVAVILTEGIIKDIHAGNDAVIVQEFIGTPLIWGIHVAAESAFTDMQQLKDQKVAISRYGSGSHLMAYVNAKNLGWDPHELEFEVVGTVEGAIDALMEQRAGYFMWEHFTTKPLVDSGVFRRIADCPTPWSCFVIAANNEFLRENSAAVAGMLKVLNRVTFRFKSIPGIETALAKKYNQKEGDIKNWLQITSWSQKQISVLELDKVQEQLKELGLISEKKENAEFFNHV